jgi:hypothetical protein
MGKNTPSIINKHPYEKESETYKSFLKMIQKRNAADNGTDEIKIQY